jgi:hypothetical protein
MAERGDGVAEAFEAHFREAIERMVADVRSTIQDVRAAVDQQLDAAMQSVQADANAIALRPQMDKLLASIPQPEPPPAPPSPAATASKLRESLAAIEEGKSQVDVLNALLDQCLAHGSRAALLILKGDAFAGWKGVGFSRFGGDDEQIKRIQIASGSLGPLARLVEEEGVVEGGGDEISSRLGFEAAARSIFVPMVIKDRVSAALYVDAMEVDLDAFDTDAIAILVFTTGLLIDTLAIRRKSPAPSLRLASAGDEVPATPNATVAVPLPSLSDSATRRPAARSLSDSATRRPGSPSLSDSATRRPTTSPGLSDSATRRAQTIADLSDSAIRRRSSAASLSDSAPRRPAPQRFEIDSPPPAVRPVPVPPETPPAAPQPPAPAAAEPSERTSTQYIPPPGLSRGGALAGGAGDAGKKHDEAKRFARLLVSEIKLYNETKVEMGRKNRDIYDRLKDDIDRSREMYEERIPEEVRRGSNYFYEELVRILADGSPDALGL